MTRQFPSFFAEMFDEMNSALEPIKKFKRQLDLFETILKFFSIVVVSEYLAGEKRIPDIDSRVIAERICTRGMGDWFQMSLEFYKNKKELPDHFFLDIFSNFFTGKNRKLMADLIELRNIKWGHGSKLSDAEYNKLIKESNEIILTLLNDLSFLTGFSLFRIVHMRILNNQNIYKLIDCSGSNLNLLPSEKTFKTLLPSEEMIIIDLKDENHHQSLHPFIILEDCGQCNQPEIFFYNGFYKEKIHYLSYKTGHEFISSDHVHRFQELLKGITPKPVNSLMEMIESGK
ncbi:MAG: hypothetical protein QG657_4922 [Acidobacteriota bacterium]|nr:hypothetical protein [Acidobacteriota bacterium]